MPCGGTGAQQTVRRTHAIKRKAMAHTHTCTFPSKVQINTNERERNQDSRCKEKQESSGLGIGKGGGGRGAVQPARTLGARGGEGSALTARERLGLGVGVLVKVWSEKVRTYAKKVAHM